MKYLEYILITILILLVGFLTYNGYIYYKYSIENNNISNEIENINNEINDMNEFITNNKEKYNDDINKNQEKVKLLKKWQTKLEEVEKSL